MGDYFGDHFICAYEQVGDFTVTTVNGKVQKNGGNVAAYFCTPEGFVLNAVAGPVPGQKLLDEAMWAVRLEGQLSRGKGDWQNDAAIVGAAHEELASDRVHAVLAKMPLAPLPAVQQAVFGDLNGERITGDRTAVLAAAARMQNAQKEGTPILFVFCDRLRPNLNPRQNIRGEAAELFYELAQPPLKGPLRNCVLIALPIDQMAALSNLTHMPAYELAERTTPTLVLADSQGKELQAIRRSTPPAALAEILWTACNEQRFRCAQQLLEQEHFQDAKRILGLIQASPINNPFKAIARRQWEALKAGRRPTPEFPEPEPPNALSQ